MRAVATVLFAGPATKMDQDQGQEPISKGLLQYKLLLDLTERAVCVSRLEVSERSLCLFLSIIRSW